MILFVFEGKKTEPKLFKTLEKLYFPKSKENLICCFGYDIYELYRLMNQSLFTEDLISVIKNKFADRQDNPLRNFSDSADFAEIYLFFDYDFQNKNLTFEQINSQIIEMLDFFNDETENGKLYINYPMIESIRCTKQLPDYDFLNYEATKDNCKNFKFYATQEYPFYKSFDFIEIPMDKKTANFKDIPLERLEFIKKNWEYIRVQNVSKANFICTGKNGIPAEKKTVFQKNIFSNQLEKYIIPKESVAILNAFPLFLFEYLRQDKLIDN